MHILVTGSAGFVGFHVARRLLAEGHSIAGLDAMVPYYDVRLKEAREAILARQPGFTAHRLDLADAPALRAVFAARPPEVVVHLAAQAGVRYAIDNPESYVSSNFVGTANLLECCRHHPVTHLVMASTSSVYGANTAMPFRERDAVVTPLNIYAATKMGTELAAHSYAHLFGIPTTAFRFFTVYGPWGRPDMALFKFTDAILNGRPIAIHGHGQMKRDFTFIDDLVEAILRLIPCVPVAGQPAGEEDSLSPAAPFRAVNIGAGAPVLLLDFVAEVERSLGRQAIREYKPIQPGEVPATWADTSLLQRLTGFVPRVGVAEGVAAFVAWYREHYRTV